VPERTNPKVQAQGVCWARAIDPTFCETVSLWGLRTSVLLRTLDPQRLDATRLFQGEPKTHRKAVANNTVYSLGWINGCDPYRTDFKSLIWEPLARHESRQSASVSCVTRGFPHWHAQVKGVEYAWTNCSGSDCTLVIGLFRFSRFHRAGPHPARNRYRDAPLSSLQW